MAIKTRPELQAEAIEIRDEVIDQANTAVRVGTHLLNEVDSSPVVSTSVAAPATTPDKRGDLHIDTVAQVPYMGLNNTASTDWKRLALFSEVPVTNTFVEKTLFDANTILKADVDNTPIALEVAEQTIVGRITAGTIDALTATEVRTLLNVQDGADVTDATNVEAAGATMNADTDLSANGYFLDEDDMISDDATKVASQQSIKAYVDSKITIFEYHEQIVISALDADLEVLASQAFWSAPFDCTLTKIKADLGTAPTGSNAIFDANDGKGGTSIMTTNKVVVESGETSSLSAATQPTLTTTSFSESDQIWFDIDQIGSTVAGKDVIITLYYNRN